MSVPDDQQNQSPRRRPDWFAVAILAAAWAIGGYFAYRYGWRAETCFTYPPNPVLGSEGQTICEHRPNPKIMAAGLIPVVLAWLVVVGLRRR